MNRTLSSLDQDEKQLELLVEEREVGIEISDTLVYIGAIFLYRIANDHSAEERDRRAGVKTRPSQQAECESDERPEKQTPIGERRSQAGGRCKHDGYVPICTFILI